MSQDGDTSRPPSTPVHTWIDDLKLLPVEDSRSSGGSCGSGSSSDPDGSSASTSYDLDLTVLSFNCLAEAYLSRRSHPNLPNDFANVAFDPKRRRELLLRTMGRFAGGDGGSIGDVNTGSSATGAAADAAAAAAPRFDVLCLQELDLLDIVLPLMSDRGYDVVHALEGYDDPGKGGEGKDDNESTGKQGPKRKGTIDRVDCCAIFFDRSKFTLIDSEIVNFDDLAGGGRQQQQKQQQSRDALNGGRRRKGSKNGTTALSGMVQSYRRRNRAVAAVLEHCKSGRRLCVSSAHLYWHPGYEYVKLSQAKYLLDKVDAMARRNASLESRLPTIVCGDFNSKPGSVVHRFLTNGTVDARVVAPWHFHTYCDELENVIETAEKVSGDDDDCGVDVKAEDAVVPTDGAGCSSGEGDDEKMTRRIEALDIGEENDAGTASSLAQDGGLTTIKAQSYGSNGSSSSPSDVSSSIQPPTVRYLLDYTLNKFTRWLRILGVDAVLETEEEEKARTSDGRMILFERCRSERRTLLTTSKTLLQRKDCPPGTYLIDPKNPAELELSLVHLLRTHGVVLRPRKFLTRCVVCNGSILGLHSVEEKRRVFKEHGCPDLSAELSVYACDGCGQGYWWCDRPTSSASRVKNQAAHLFRLCLRGGVAIEGGMHMFDFVNVEKERRIGEESGTFSAKGGPMEEIIGWLKNSQLSHPFGLRSAFAMLDEDDKERVGVVGELLPFTNVTAEFVGALDYILYEQSSFEQTHRLFVPTSFRELNADSRSGGHLLPSNVWPSDHLAVGCKMGLKPLSSNVVVSEKSINGRMVKQAVAIDPSEKSNDGEGTNDQSGALYCGTVGSQPSVALPTPHKPRCACGCVPQIFSLFEMAEMRKQAKLKAQREKANAS